MNPNGAIIVQSNLEIMVEVDNPNYPTARDAIAPFTELVKSPEHLHTYKISHLSLWNAAATGLRAPEVLERLESQSRYPIPPTVVTEIEDYMARYGLLRLRKEGNRLMMESDDKIMFLEICKLRDVEPFIIEYIDDMASYLAAADLVISRAGASSISEFCLLGKPVILVPSPNVAENHQYHNAMALVNKGAAIHVADDQAADTLLRTAIETVGDSTLLAYLSKNILSLGKKNSAEAIADRVIELARKKTTY
jgi:UDP-N-acetylglucosamine transferase subunit ALG13